MPQRETKPAVADIIKTWTSIQGLHTTEEDLLRVNPNYSKDGQYKVNCQRCVQTYELRRRGYDVSAMPKPTDAGANPIIWGAECFVKPNAGESLADAAYNKFTFGQTKEDIQKVLENAPRNCRYVIYVQWQKVKASHVFIAQKDNGVIRYIAPQTGDSDVKRYFDIGKNSNFGYCRLDNKPITDNNEILRSTVKGEKNDSK